MLNLSDYRDAIDLDEPFPVPLNDKRSTYDLLMTALNGLRDRHYTGGSMQMHLSTDDGLMRWLQAELAMRDPAPIDPIVSRAINTLLYREMGKHGRVEGQNLRRVSELLPSIDYSFASNTILYRGDIRQVVVDAVVNPALPELIGCKVPLHGCLDSVIHAQAGPWLDNDLATIMDIQGTDVEEPGQAKITRGYRMPSKYLIHTVGPDVRDGQIDDNDRKVLHDCYWNALTLAQEQGDVESIVFPAISTGYNGFPVREAATIALGAVEHWMDTHNTNIELVIFAVHSDADAETYIEVLSEWVAD